MNLKPIHRFRYWLILLLAAGMVLVYPAHLIVGHSGLMDHHHNEHQKDNGAQDETGCSFCVTLHLMEGSESVVIRPPGKNGLHHTIENRVYLPDSVQTSHARAPPSLFLVSESCFL